MVLGAGAGSSEEDFACSSKRCAREGDHGGSSPSPCPREGAAGCTAFLLPHRPVPQFLLQIAAVCEVGSVWPSAGGLNTLQTLLGGDEMGGAPCCSLLVVAKNPTNPVAIPVGGSLGLARGGGLPPPIGGPARTQFGGLWSAGLCWKGLP